MGQMFSSSDDMQQTVNALKEHLQETEQALLQLQKQNKVEHDELKAMHMRDMREMEARIISASQDAIPQNLQDQLSEALRKGDTNDSNVRALRTDVVQMIETALQQHDADPEAHAGLQRLADEMSTIVSRLEKLEQQMQDAGAREDSLAKQQSMVKDAVMAVEEAQLEDGRRTASLERDVSKIAQKEALRERGRSRTARSRPPGPANDEGPLASVEPKGASPLTARVGHVVLGLMANGHLRWTPHTVAAQGRTNPYII